MSVLATAGPLMIAAAGGLKTGENIIKCNNFMGSGAAEPQQIDCKIYSKVTIRENCFGDKINTRTLMSRLVKN